MPLHPTVLWAQRADVLYLTVEISDIKNHKIDLTEDKLRFTGVGEKEENEYEAEIEFYKQIDVEKSKQHLTPRNLTMAIYKKDEGWWPKLQKGDKLNFVKTDFQKWRDEDDEEEEGEAADPMGGLDFQSLMAQAGAAGGLPNMDDNMPEADEDSDDEQEEANKA
ncbi:HSP20-like chaperone [Gilbertella persicaria]|uniref:HSP20-like chaperone n=1 Tax=Gilbertella persicaria TaxID=101096 RepID=UPI00221E6A68|nr:HSP20-like chaperone [Gilbertella persicaria]KAI8073432.1 HSP20-like chaperone [Gilbertella persicaria]